MIRAFEPEVVPRLLQTEDYARAVVASRSPTGFPEDAADAATPWLARQDLLWRTGSPAYQVVLDEAVPRRQRGSSKVMYHQIGHLIDMARRPDVTIQILPFTAPWRPILYGSFSIVWFPDPVVPDMVYAETLGGTRCLSKPDETARYSRTLARLLPQAASPLESMAILRDIQKEA